MKNGEILWQNTFDAISDGVWILSPEGCIIQSNGVFERMLGLKIGDVTGQYCYNAAHCKSDFIDNCPFSRMKVIGIRQDAEFEDKERGLWFQITVDPIRDKSGMIKSAVHIVRNITESKKMEEELRRQTARTRMLADISQRLAEAGMELHAVLDTVALGVAELIGDACIIRLLSDDGLWLDPVAFFHPDPEPRTFLCGISGSSRNGVNEGLNGRVMKTGKAELIQAANLEQIKHLMGEDCQYVDRFGVHSIIIVPLHVQGRTIGTLTISRDVSEFPYTEDDFTFLQNIADRAALAIENARLFDTVRQEIVERRRAEEQIREQATLLDKAQDAIAVRDLEHRLIYWNKGAERMYGWTAEEVAGRNANELLYKGEVPHLIEARKTVMEEGEWMGELHQITKDGREIIVEGRWTLVRDPSGKPKSILIINTDITEKKKLEAQFLRVQRMESIGTLAGGIAHDLNNLLTPMMLSLQILKEKFKDEESQNLLGILEKNSHRGADLIKQVLSFARGMEGERKTIQVTHLIFEIGKIVKETFPRSIEILTDVPPNLWMISGDATQLHQVLMNLCVNARDAMPDGGILRICAENILVDDNFARMHIDAGVGPYIVITVSDNGTGIPPGIIDRIFEPFFTTKKHGEGTGLGLSTVLAIVKSHGGFITVYSDVGKGASFKLHLPAITTDKPKKAQFEQVELPAGHGESILVVDDESPIRDVTSKMLETNGYRAITACDGAEAVALYVQNKKDIRVVLMDMMMPVMDGQSSIRILRKINPQVRIIAVSGLTEKEKVAKIVDNAHAFLQKPYTAERLLKTIKQVIEEKC